MYTDWDNFDTLITTSVKNLQSSIVYHSKSKSVEIYNSIYSKLYIFRFDAQEEKPGKCMCNANRILLQKTG